MKGLEKGGHRSPGAGVGNGGWSASCMTMPWLQTRTDLLLKDIITELTGDTEN